MTEKELQLEAYRNGCQFGFVVGVRFCRDTPQLINSVADCETIVLTGSILSQLMANNALTSYEIDISEDGAIVRLTIKDACLSAKH